jgi:hypothetical protein
VSKYNRIIRTGVRRSQPTGIDVQGTQDLDTTTMQVDEVIPAAKEVDGSDGSDGSGGGDGGDGGDDDGSGIVNEGVEGKNEDFMMDLLIDEAREAMEQDEAEAVKQAAAANQRPQWERGPSVLAERQAPLDAHERRASQSLRFTQNADGERIVAAVQRPDPMGSQSPMYWESVLSGGAAAVVAAAGNSRSSLSVSSEAGSSAKPAARDRGELETASSSVRKQLSQRQQVNQRKAMRKKSEARELREMNVFLDEIDEEIDEATPEGTKRKYGPIQDDFEVCLFISLFSFT